MPDVELKRPDPGKNSGRETSVSGSPAPAEVRDPRFAELDSAIKTEDLTTQRPATTTPSKRRVRKHQPGARQVGARQTADKALAQGKEFARRLGEITRREFGRVLNRREFIQVAQEFRSAVVPRRTPGRKPSTRVTRAYADYQAGKHGIALYREHIPGFEKLGPRGRRTQADKLMAAIRTRRRRDQLGKTSRKP